MDWALRTALRLLVVAVCLWVAAHAAIGGAEVLAGSLGVPVGDVLRVVVLGTTLLIVASWNPKRSNSRRRSRGYYR